MTLTLAWPLLRSRASFWSAQAPTRTHPFGSGYRRNKVIMLPVKSQCKINLAPASDNKTYPATFFNIFIENNFLCSSIQIYVVIVQKLVIFAGQCFLVHALKHWRIKKTPIVPSSADRPLSCSLLLLLENNCSGYCNVAWWAAGSGAGWPAAHLRHREHWAQRADGQAGQEHQAAHQQEPACLQARGGRYYRGTVFTSLIMNLLLSSIRIRPIT